MSSVVETVENVVVETNTSEKKPSLSAKLEKFMVFGYWFLDHLHNTDIISDEKFVELKEELRMYSTVEEQTEFYQQFLDDTKISSKELKKDIRDHFKPKKAQKEKVAKGVNAVEKRGRKKKAVVNEQIDPLVAEMVAAANGEQPVVEPAVEPVVETVVEQVVEPAVEQEKPKRKYNRKSKAEVPAEVPVEVPAEVPVEVPVEVPADVPVEVLSVEQEKPKRKNNRKQNSEVTEPAAEVVPVENVKKTKKAKEPKEAKEKKTKAAKKEVVPEPVAEINEKAEEDDDEAMPVRELKYKGEVYLIDEENVVYTIDQERIGVYNTETEDIDYDVE
jgi:hypothetical protein